jgi:hypothetical protein
MVSDRRTFSKDNEKLVSLLAQSYNDLTPAIVTECFAEEIVYESQYVMGNIVGKLEVADYLTAKMDTISQHIDTARVYAEIGYWRRTPCIVMAQGSPEQPSSVILVKCEDDLITRIDICAVPSPDRVKRTGVYPSQKDNQ